MVIRGTVAADAQARRTRDGNTVLTVDMHAPAASGQQPVTVRVQQPFGTGEAAAYAATARARRLRRGVRVEASGQGLRRMRGALVLEGVDQLHEPDLVLRNVTGERDT